MDYDYITFTAAHLGQIYVQYIDIRLIVCIYTYKQKHKHKQKHKQKHKRKHKQKHNHKHKHKHKHMYIC